MSYLLTKLFGPPEEINGANRCPTYLYRWTLAKFRGRGIYLHHFVDDDWSLDLHDHPKRFISIGLKGGYIELTPCTGCGTENCGVQLQRVFRAPWVRTFPAEHVHRLEMFRKQPGVAMDCWTMVIVLKSTRGWGFWHKGKFIGWREYVGGKTADARKSC